MYIIVPAKLIWLMQVNSAAYFQIKAKWKLRDIPPIKPTHAWCLSSSVYRIWCTSALLCGFQHSHLQNRPSSIRSAEVPARCCYTKGERGEQDRAQPIIFVAPSQPSLAHCHPDGAQAQDALPFYCTLRIYNVCCLVFSFRLVWSTAWMTV